MQIDTANLKISTKSIVTGLLAFGAFMQIPAVNAFVIAQTTLHPKLTGLITAISGVYAVLHNPQVQEALGVKQTVTTESVTVAPEPPK